MEKFVADSPAYRTRSVFDLMSLKGKTVIITGRIERGLLVSPKDLLETLICCCRPTGGARGLGLAWVRGCAEVGADVAVIDILDAPDPDFELLEKECKVKARYYR
jgi:hypothetical protein